MGPGSPARLSPVPSGPISLKVEAAGPPSCPVCNLPFGGISVLYTTCEKQGITLETGISPPKWDTAKEEEEGV